MHILDVLKERGFIAQTTFEDELYKQHILEAVFAACGVAAVDGGDDFLTVQH